MVLLKESRIAQQDPAELLKFRNGVERAFKSTTIKMTQQWNQVAAQSQGKIQELTAGNQNDITISEVVRWLVIFMVKLLFFSVIA